MQKQLMFFVDFDGTITREDICYSMVKQFARNGWEEINRLWEEGTLSTEECAQRTLELLEAEPNELEAFFKKADIDKSFIPFLNWANHKDYPIYILSDGYDNYIKEILRMNGLNVPYYANHLEYDQGWRIKCLHLDKECKKCGVCKTGLIEDLLKPEYISIYIGDGYSDICPAENCDMVFAKDHLARLCNEKGINFYNYNSFNDIKRIIQESIN